MTHFFSRTMRSMKAGITTGAIIAMAALLPMVALAADPAKLDSSAGVANVTARETAYKAATNAADGQIVKLQVYYVNQEEANSNRNAENVRMKITLPTEAGKAKVIKSSVKGDNTDAVEREATVNVDSDDAVLQYVPGSATWKHNAGTNDAPKAETVVISDEVVTGAQGVVLENQKPGNNFAATVTILARVTSPGVKVTKQSQLKGETNKWSASNTANPGDTMRYMISYQNTGSSEQRAVVVRDTLPANMELVPGTTFITNAANPNGAKFESDAVTAGGINIGNYAAGANAFVTFEAKIAAADKLKCGGNEFRNTAYVRPDGLNDYYASAVTNVNRDCEAKPAAAVYSCDKLTVTKLDGRKVQAKVDYTAREGASLKTVTYNWGDGSTPLTTDKTTVEYTYPKDGSFPVTANMTFTVNGKDQTAPANNACGQTIAVAAVVTPTPPAPAPTPAPSTSPSALPNTGTGEVLGFAAVVAVIGTLGHRLYLSRKLAQ